MSGAAIATRPRGLATAVPSMRRNAWTLGLLVLLVFLLAFTKFIQPTYGAAGIQGLAISILPLALAAVAQAIVVISGGIDLSIGSIMALVNVVTAVLMAGHSGQFGVLVVVAALVLGAVVGGVNGGLVVATRVPDIVVTLATSYVWAGAALLILNSPGGSASPWLMNLVNDSIGRWIPQAAIVLIVVVAVIWVPLRRSRLGLSIYAIGSNQLAAFRSGVPVGRTKLLAYVFMGVFAALAGLSVTASTGIGSPVPGPYTLMSIAAVVLGGVSLAGGRGGVLGPVLAVLVLQVVQTDMTLLNVDTNLASVLQGFILVGVVVLGTLSEIRRARA